ncbi:PH domain-containing protein [Paractinoplanes atraurantiacus]|uniref:PH domain-containing protein n=1 Tax=Paractinoplanes atraurantiacus TaxID=1036182 RepID=A0A285KE90_9ACTN|nr:PH domain-containing protein [Actinoplanes atraurantiacus]SNY70922.1 PH domain-containing protein [Actinoplanes atraurantiacus]
METTWERPYTPGTGRWLVIGWEIAALALLGWATARQFDLSGHGIRVLAGVLAAVWVLGSYRILQMGAYVGPAGLRIRGLLRSHTMSWAEIAHVRLHKATHKLGPWEIESGLTVLIERADGSTVNTELWAQGVDFHSRPKLFKAVYHELRNRHLEARNPI